MTVNYTTLAMLASEDVKTVGVKFQGSSKVYTFKTLIQDLKKDDLVVVQSSQVGNISYDLTIVKVVSIKDADDFDDNLQYKWIVSKVDMEAFADILAREEKLVSQVRTQINKTKRQKMVEALGVDMNKLEKF